MALSLEEIRGLVLKAFKQPSCRQIAEVEIIVGNLKAQMLGTSQQQRGYVTDGRGYLERGETTLINEAVWTLIVEGVIVPGADDSNQGWPWLRLTEYGERCVAANEILPHDPEGYLRAFHQAVPGTDPIIAEYLSESLQCFLRGLNRASAVMLGAASEKAVLLLIDGYANAIGDANRQAQAKSQVEKASSIFRKYDVFEKGLRGIQSTVPRSLTDNLDSLLRGIFDLIRNSRNEAGHPASGILVSRDANYSHLRLFIPYCKRVYELIDWFSTNSI